MADPDLADARWFAVDLHVPDRRFKMLRLDDELIARESFLDTRLPVPLAEAAPLAVEAVAAAALPQAPVHWLFHTSFCASTLLARALHAPPFAVSLKEPLVLRRLSDAKKSGWPLDGLVAPAVKLLARPWHPGGAVVIKPTHVALNIARELLAATPASRAVLLTSLLEDFLVSNLKKPPESQDKVPVLAERALRETTFRARLPAVALAPPDVICAAGLQWAAQRELALDIVEAARGRIIVLSAAALICNTPRIARRIASQLALPTPADDVSRAAVAAAGRHAKAIEAPYSADQRAREAATIEAQFRVPLGRARAWLDTHVLPVMRPEARSL